MYMDGHRDLLAEIGSHDSGDWEGGDSGSATKKPETKTANGVLPAHIGETQGCQSESL